MILVVDTNAVWNHADLDGKAWGTVKTAVADGVLTVVIPHVVADELTARIQENRRAVKPKPPSRRDLGRAPQAARDAIDAAFETAHDEIEQWAASYDAAAVFKAARFVVRPAPDVPHEEIAYRAANRIRPFDVDGNGYRDTLHWFTVLELARENRGEHIVLLSGDKKAYWEAGALHSFLEEEMAPLLVDGTSFNLVRNLSDIEIPSKYAGEEESVTLTDTERDALIEALFEGGSLRAPELWNAMPILDPVDAEISDPENPTVVFAYTRQLSDGGNAYRTRLRLSARAVFDWLDWMDDADDEGRRENLEITAWYTLDSAGIALDRERTDVQPAPFEKRSRITIPHDDLGAAGKISSSLTGRLFDTWKINELTGAIGAKITADLLRSSGYRALNDVISAQGSQITADLLGAHGATRYADIVRPNALSIGADLARANRIQWDVGVRGAATRAAREGYRSQNALADVAGRIARGEVDAPVSSSIRRAAAQAQDEKIDEDGETEIETDDAPHSRRDDDEEE